MGFDLIGVKPASKKGEYFRNNIWWWRPLASYVVARCDITDEGWFENSGHEVPARKAQRIAHTLYDLLLSGDVQTYAMQYQKDLDALPDEQCNICHGSGVRADEFVQGTCNACGGKGTVVAWDKNYPFSEENVREFAEFCRESGGFSIC